MFGTWTLRIGIGAVALIIGFLLGYSFFFGPVEASALPQEFIVLPDQSVEEVVSALKQEGLIRNEWAFRLAFLRYTSGKGIRPGGYSVSKSMDTLMVAKTLTSPPPLAFVVVPSGMRKEELADYLADTLGWSEAGKQEWLTTGIVPGFEEGVFYPDTYLIPARQAPREVAERLQSRFQDETKDYAIEAERQGIKWSTVLTLASLVEREAARNDKALVAGILWNRLEREMLLQVDASLQYIKGNSEDGWWRAPKSEDKYLESPFNTYQHEGLPPHPIATPSLASIEAVLSPESTSCLYYLHDPQGRIHCSPNYAGHLANVDRYLR